MTLVRPAGAHQQVVKWSVIQWPALSWNVSTPNLLRENVAGHVHGVSGRVEHMEARQSGHRFADDISKFSYLNESVYILIKFPLKFIIQSPIDNKSALGWGWGNISRARCKIIESPLLKQLGKRSPGLGTESGDWIAVRTLHVRRRSVFLFRGVNPDSKGHGANMGPTWVMSAPCWPHELCDLRSLCCRNPR